MLFNSYVFILAFFPVVFLGYRLFVTLKWYETGKIYLVLASLYFYSYFKWDYLLLLVISILVNYGLCCGIQKSQEPWKKWLTIAGCVFNLGILGYFKYTGFLFENLNLLLKTSWSFEKIILPLGISFYTFQQLSFLIDCYHGDKTRYSLTDYSLFVTFFPQLIAGPIVLPGEMLPQFEDPARRPLNWENMNIGLYLFTCGLAKKCFLADSIAFIVSVGFDSTTELTFAESWVTFLAFPLQIYFDFSGYCDMASGIAKWFNLDLPINFNSPYKATSFRDFWKRWHITLGRFMMNYLYFPLGGSRCGLIRTLFNQVVIFFICGLWHGAAWSYVIWGLLNGIGILLHRLWRYLMDQYCHEWYMPRIPAVILTFFSVNWISVIFRAPTLQRAWSILCSMFDVFRIAGFTKEFRKALGSFDLSRDQLLAILFLALFMVFFIPNSYECNEKLKKHPFARAALTVLFGIVGFLCVRRVSPFLYFNF